MNSKDVIKKIKANGCFLAHVVGPHHQFKHPARPRKVTVSHPKKDLPQDTMKSIFSQAGL